MLHACIDKQQALIDDFKTRIHALLENEGLGNEEEYDNTELSYLQQRMDELNGIEEGLTFANSEMEQLQKMDANAMATYADVAPGAVVVTNLGTFFIAVSTERFEVDDQTFIGISAKSPLFFSMRGKKAGEKFSYHSITYAIRDVF